MIEVTLENIRTYLEYKFKDEGHEGWEVILNAIDKDGPKSPGLYITLLRIEEESSIKKQGRFVKGDNTNDIAPHYANPDLCVNLYILISAFAENYNTGLMQISSTMRLLNNIHDFKYAGMDEEAKQKAIEEENRRGDAKARTANAMRSLSIELQHLSAEQMNSIWQTVGAKVMPAVCYKVRMLTLSAVDNSKRPHLITGVSVKEMPLEEYIKKHEKADEEEKSDTSPE